MTFVWTYLASLAVFLGVDALWLTFVMSPIFNAYVAPLLRDSMRIEAAAVFYLFYVAGVLYLATLPGLRANSLMLALGHGAIIGFLAYGTYEATNMTTLKGWSWTMVFVDTSWGVFLTALVAGVGYIVAPMVGYGR